MRTGRLLVTLATLGALAATAVAAVPRGALAAVQVPSSLSISVPGTVKAGVAFDIGATLTAGGPVSGASLHLFLNGNEVKQAKTDAGGNADFHLAGDLSNGTYSVAVQYLGDNTRADLVRPGPASAYGSLTVQGIALVVHTVPPLPGMTFTLDGTPFSADGSGTATVNVASAGQHTVGIQLPPDTQTERVRFARWEVDDFSDTRTLRITTDTTLFAGFQLSYLTPIHFVDLDGHGVDQRRVSGVTLTGPNADSISLSPPYDPVWLSTPLPSKHAGEPGIFITPAPYAVATGDFDGLDVVSRGAVRYAPRPGGVWSIPLLLYEVRLHAQDALLGTPLQRHAVLTDGRGQRQDVVLDAHGDATVTGLSRGDYTIQVLADGISPAAPVALSKSQDVLIRVISVADLLILAGALGLVVFVLFVLGRRRSWLLLPLRPFRGGRRRSRGLVPPPVRPSATLTGRRAPAAPRDPRPAQPMSGLVDDALADVSRVAGALARQGGVVGRDGTEQDAAHRGSVAVAPPWERP